MEPLLIVLVAVCALAFAVQAARGLWVRARSVERHQQALDTLAGIAHGSATPNPTTGSTTGGQAHVRVIGPTGQDPDESRALPPPRAFTRAQGPSPFRRPGRPARPATGTGDTTLGAPEGAEAGTRASEGVSAAATDRDAYVARITGEGPRQEPELTPAPPAPAVPEPQVLHFDDLASWTRSGAGRGDDTGATLPGAGTQAGAAGLAQLAPLERRSSTKRQPTTTSKPLAQRVLAAAAVAVAAAAVTATAIVSFGGLHSPTRSATGPSGNAGATSRSSGPTSSNAAGTKGTTSTTGAEPAVFQSFSNGTATYQLSSPNASIELKASGPCWIKVTAGSPYGQVKYQTTLGTGQQFTVTGPAWIRLGDPPYVTVTVDGWRMKVPGEALSQPLNLEFTLG
jgi:hypothetical protein